MDSLFGDGAFFRAAACFHLGCVLPMAPLVPFRIRDSYIGGKGASEASVAGVIRVSGQRDTPEVASASLVGFLAEAAWVPTALLPDEEITWTEIDDQNARVTLTDMQTTVSIYVHFGEPGGMDRNSTMRYRDVKGHWVLTPWVGYFRDYTRIQGMMIPMTAEVQWVLPEGVVSVWKGHIETAEYQFAL